MRPKEVEAQGPPEEGQPLEEEAEGGCVVIFVWCEWVHVGVHGCVLVWECVCIYIYVPGKAQSFLRIT